MTRARLLLLLALAVALLSAALPSGRGPGPVPPLSAPAALAQAGEPRIVGGTLVPVGTYRFTTLLYITFPPNTYLCGGTLIDQNYVLTAAHCVTSGSTTASPGNVSAYVGANDRTTLATTSEARGVSRVAVHPGWNSSTFQNDVAVLRLSSPVTTIAPIPLPAAGSTTGLADGTMLTADGWGRTSTAGATSNVLLEAQVPVQSSAGCDAQYWWFDPASMMCAGPSAGGAGICFGDSGGPLFLNQSGAFTQIGITSWTESSGCALPGRPAGYAKIADPTIRNWIALEVSGAATPTPTAIPTSTPTPIPTRTPTPVPGSTSTPTPMPTPTMAPTQPPTATPTPQPSATASVTPTRTSTPTATPTSTQTPGPAPTATPARPTATPIGGGPRVAIASPSDGSKVKTSFTVSVLATDDSARILRVALDECRNGECREIAGDDTAPYDFSVTLKKGKRTLRAVAVDAAGAMGVSEEVTVQVGKKKKRR